MKALTLTQPWASLVACDAKRFETRSWGTRYRGPLLIHAAKGFPADARELCQLEPFASALRRLGLGGLALLSPEAVLPLGEVVAVANLTECDLTQAALARYPIEGTDEAQFGDYSRGRYAWKLEAIRPLARPVPATGRLGLWDAAPELLDTVRADGVEPEAVTMMEATWQP